jgi:uncharacterized membrane protein
MSQVLFSLSTWLHAVATVVLIGHYLLLSVIYLPVLAQAKGGGAMLSAISKRSRVWLYSSLLVFAITGIHLTVADANYLSLGNFGNPWSILMLGKHVLVLAMIALGFWFNAVLRVGPAMRSDVEGSQAIARFSLYARLMAGLGLIVLLLTAIVQFA